MDNDSVIKKYMQITGGNVPKKIRRARRTRKTDCQMFYFEGNKFRI